MREKSFKNTSSCIFETNTEIWGDQYRKAPPYVQKKYLCLIMDALYFLVFILQKVHITLWIKKSLEMKVEKRKLVLINIRKGERQRN